jgi:dTDP-4-dehydrorhamnose 3,5-epimerase
LPLVDLESLSIPDVKLVRVKRHSDSRGYFAETWNRRDFAAAGIDVEFVQDNASHSKGAGTIRGLHFQRPPHAQAKLVHVVRGAILDVAVDLRSASPTYGRHVAVELTAESGDQLFVPVGFAHGFCTLEADTEVAYKTSEFYAREHDAGILWSDPALGIDWPLGGRAPVLSERDTRHPLLADAAPGF